MIKEDVYTIISEHMDLLGKNKLESISNEMNISLEDVKNIEIIKLLDPKPGQNISSKNAEYIIPEYM